MLRKRLGLEVIERGGLRARRYFKIPSSLIIPESCKKIGSSAFENCISLREVVFTESVEYIGRCAFEGCWWLKKVVIPKGCKVIEDNAFWGCEEATIIIMNKSSESDFKYFGRRAFRDCKEVKYVKEEAGN